MGNRFVKKKLVVFENIPIEQLESAADQYYGNIMAVIKLR